MSDLPIEEAAPFDDLDGEFGGLLNEDDIAIIAESDRAQLSAALWSSRTSGPPGSATPSSAQVDVSSTTPASLQLWSTQPSRAMYGEPYDQPGPHI